MGMRFLTLIFVCLSRTVINLALVIAAGLIQQTKAETQTPKLLGHDFVVEFPTGGPFDEKTPHLDWNGWKLEVRPDGTLGRRYLSDGGWGDFRNLYAEAQTAKVRHPYRVKVIVVQYTTVIETGKTGIVRQRRGSLTDDELATIVKSLGTFKGMVEGVTKGSLQVTIDANLDGDPVVQTESLGATPPNPHKLITLDSIPAEGLPFGSRYVATDIAPQFNDEKFDTDDGVYHGPFDSVFVIYAGLATGTTVMVDHTPVTTIPYFDGQYQSSAELPVRLYDAWKGQLGMAAAKGKGENFVSSYTDSQYPRIVAGPYFEALLEANLQRGNAANGGAVDANSAAAAQLSQLQWQDPNQLSGTLVPFEAADVVTSRLGGSKVEVSAWRMSPNGPQVVLEGVSDQDVVRASKPEGVAVSPEPVPEPGATTGLYDCVVGASSTGGKSFEIKQKGTVAKGHVVLFSGPKFVPDDTRAGFVAEVKLSSDENICLALYSGSTKVGTVLLGGDVPGSAELGDDPHIVDRSVPADDQWHKVSVPLKPLMGDRALTEIRVEAPYRCRYERLNRGPVTIGVQNLDFVAAADLVSQPAPAGPDVLDELLKIGPEPDDAQKQALLSALKSPSSTTKLTALSILAKVKFADSIPALSELSQASSIPYAKLAIEALAFQDTPEAWAQIRQTLEHGTFDHNRRFAAIEIARKPDPAMAAALNFMATRSTHARLEAVRALGKLKTTSATVFMATILNLDPEPIVRLEIARNADPNDGLMSKRMIYAAVNDPSQWVRAVSFAALIDSTDKEVEQEALNGVRDDAVGVRLYLLETMQKRAKDSYRPALRIAVTDTNPSVRAAALRAFATQPGPVDPNEVKNVFNDSDPEVKQALAALATAKGFKVPKS